MEQKIGNSNSRIVAIITMCFIFAMISFVTNMGAPFGNIWGFKYTWASMMGNMMNFAAYLFMGIPAGKMLESKGYKKTALIALAVGTIGLLIQYMSSPSTARLKIPPHMIEVQKPQSAMSTHLVGIVNATTPVPWSSNFKRLAISESPEREKFKVLLSGKKIAMRSNTMATKDTVVI